MNAALRSIIDEAYGLFAPYTIGRTLAVCKACCISDAEELELVSTPLRRISSDLFSRAYFESAHYHTAQELWEMKHFLPRVLELVSDYDFPGFTSDVIFQRLTFDQTTAWTGPERALVNAFAQAFFRQSLTHYPLPNGYSLANLVVMFGIAYFDVAPLLNAWAADEDLPGLLHLANLFFYDIDLSSDKSAHFTDAFATPAVQEAVEGWLQDGRVRHGFRQRLEERLLTGPALPEEEATALSLAYEGLTAIDRYL